MHNRRQRRSLLTTKPKSRNGGRSLGRRTLKASSTPCGYYMNLDTRTLIRSMTGLGIRVGFTNVRNEYAPGRKTRKEIS